CIGEKSNSSQPTPLPEPKPVSGGDQPEKLAHIQVSPVEWMASTGDQTAIEVRGFNAAGQPLGTLDDVQFEIVGSGKVQDGSYQVPEIDSPSTVYVTAKAGELQSVGRFRVYPPLPWKFDFEDGKVPVTWTGANYRHQPKELPDGGQGLVKVSTIPK